MEISSVELQKKINAGEKLMIEFHGVWCGPCKLMKPIFEKIAKENTSDVQMYTMDIDENKEAAISLGIRSIPTVKMFNSGEVVETKVGLLNEGQINNLLTELING
jgi:thioredoxin 1